MDSTTQPEDPERIARLFIARQLHAGNEVKKDWAVDELLRRQGIVTENGTAARDRASQNIMKIFESYNFSGVSRYSHQWRIIAMIKKDLNCYSDYKEGPSLPCETQSLSKTFQSLSPR